MSAFRKIPGTRNVDLRLYGQQLLGAGPENITGEDYLRVGGKKALEFLEKYKDNPLITDLLNRYQYATYGSAKEANPLTTFDKNDPAYRKPVRDFDGPITISNMPDILSLPIKSLNDLKRQLKMATEGKGDAAPQVSDGESTEREERRLENFQRQARKDFINFKDFLGEEVSEEERERAFRSKVDYGEDFTPIGGRRNVEYEPNIDIGYTAPFLNRDYEPITRTPKSDFTAIDPDRDLEYTPLEELDLPLGPREVLNEPDLPTVINRPIINRPLPEDERPPIYRPLTPEEAEESLVVERPPFVRSVAQGGLVGLPTIYRSEGGNGYVDQQEAEGDINPDTDLQGNQRNEEQYSDPFGDLPGYDFAPPPGPTVDSFIESIKKDNPNIDPSDLETALDLKIDAFNQGLPNVNVNVDLDPDGFPIVSYEGPGAVGFGISKIAEGIGGLASLGGDFYRGMSSLTPAGIIRDILIDKKGNLPGGRIRQSIFDRQEPFITDPFGRGITKTLLGDPTGSVEIKSAIAKEFDKLTSKEKTEVEEKVKEGKSPEKAIEEVKMTRENFSSTMERLFGDQLREGLYE